MLYTSIELIQEQKLVCQSDTIACGVFFFPPNTLKIVGLNKMVNDELHVNIIFSPFWGLFN